MSDPFEISYLDALPLPAVIVDHTARIIGANARAIALQPQANEQRPFVLVFRQPDMNEAVQTCVTTTQAQQAIYFHNDGPQELRFNATFAPVTRDQGTGVLVCFQDISESHQLDRMRRDFVANVSHELRSPLTAILGFIETLLGPARDDAAVQQKFLGIMAAEARRMNRLVGDLLSLSRVEEVSRMRPTDAVDIDALLRSAIANLEPLAQDNASQLIYLRQPAPLIIPADADQLMQVVTNLIENGLKYGGQGTTVTLELDELDHGPGRRGTGVGVTITDDGPGIEDRHLPRLTERFYRIDSHRSREQGGTGLGLAIVKHIVNRHRGRLIINSTPGQGSSFSVILPKT